jgi:hypothetical protein
MQSGCRDCIFDEIFLPTAAAAGQWPRAARERRLPDQALHERGHRGSLVDKDPDVSLRPGLGDRRPEGDECVVVFARGLQRERPERSELDQAVCASLGAGQRLQAIQQVDDLSRFVPGELQPGHHQMFAFTRV